MNPFLRIRLFELVERYEKVFGTEPTIAVMSAATLTRLLTREDPNKVEVDGLRIVRNDAVPFGQVVVGTPQSLGIEKEEKPTCPNPS